MIATERVLLRQWTAEDREPFAALNADPEVMEHFPNPLSRRQSDELADRLERVIAEHGWGPWAAVERDSGRFMGFIGLLTVAPVIPVRGVEIGWRLARWAWGSGYATEGARAALAYAWDELGLPEVVSFTAVGNVRSRAVMERIGMAHDPSSDFEHPGVPRGLRVRPHVVYRVARPDGVAPDGISRPAATS